MNRFSALFYGVCGAAMGYIIGAVIASLYQAALESTEKTITAKDILDNGMFPWLFAIGGFFIAYKIIRDDERK